MIEPTVPPTDQSTQSTSSTTHVTGGINVTADHMNIGGDVIARDKTVQAGTYIEHLTVVAPQPIAPPADEAPAPGEPPFKGLQHFDEADADLFFGREALTAKLVARVRDDRFLAIVGASGSGKSSVVRAGLIPAMKRDHPRWPIHLITPTAHPLKELAASLTRDVESVTATSTLIDDLNRDERSLDLAVAKLLKQDSRGDRLLLIVDQFEELFTACKDEAERRTFVNNLLHAAALDTDGPTTVVITLRADFYAHCAQFEQLREALSQHQEYIGPMNADELRRAIEEPARRKDWQFEPDLVDLILRDVGSEPGALPLLSHALLETWQRRRGRMLTLQGYTEAGGVRSAIARTADAVLAALKPDQQIVARNIFLRLTELGEGTQDTRRRAALSELIARSEGAAMTEVVLKTLTDARLITTGDDMAEVAHEALIREWPQLRSWLDEDREALRLHRRLTEAAVEWDSHGREASYLYRGGRLSTMENWARTHAAELNLLEQTFLRLSAQGRQRAQLSRMTLLAVGLTAGLAVAALAIMVIFGIGPFAPRLKWSPVERFAGSSVNDIMWIDSSTGYVGLEEGNLPSTLARSRDGGVTWEFLNLRAKGVKRLARDPIHANVIYAAADGPGLFRSQDGGDTWTELNSRQLVNVSSIDSLAVSASGALYVSDFASSAGVYASNNGGETWLVMRGAPPSPIYFLSWVDNHLLVGTEYGLWQWSSEDQWSSLLASDQSDQPARIFTALKADDVLVAAGSGIFELPSNDPILHRRFIPFAGIVNCIDQDVNEMPPRLVASTATGQVIQWKLGDAQTETIATGSDLNGALAITVVRVRPSPSAQFWVGTNNGLVHGEMQR